MERRTLRLRREALAELEATALYEVVAGMATARTLCCLVTQDYTLCRRCPTDAAG